MNGIKHIMKSWEIKYGQILIGVEDYNQAIKLFSRYLDQAFEIETLGGVFRGKKFLHYKNNRILRLACKPFFEKLKEGDIIYLQPSTENAIKYLGAVSLSPQSRRS
ncbi:MAG: hypothetical protein QMD21_03945 [Candidatus Thermoplasmatota archaeon]|nr:hypothetical protein [Candidatus Thermoplasmatota archaeon]